MFLDIKKQRRETNEKEVNVGENNHKKIGKLSCEAVLYLGPLHVVAKGHAKRFKSSKEKAQKKFRLCWGCNKRRISHDRHNSPAILKRCDVQNSAVGLTHRSDVHFSKCI